MNGLLISFDGIDSSGKATQAYRLAQRLATSGRRVSQWQSPDYSTATGRQLKQLLQHAAPPLSWQKKMRLFAANRAEHRGEVVAQLQQGGIVVYDRYVPSSLAFITIEATAPQDVDHMRALIQAAVAHEEYDVNQMPREDVSIFLDVPPSLALALLEERKLARGERDEYTDHRLVQERLYNEYDILCRTVPGRFVRIPCLSGTALLGVDDVSELVWTALTARLPTLASSHAQAA